MLCLLCHDYIQIVCIYIYITRTISLLDRHPGHLRQRCAQFTQCLFAQSGSQVFLGVLPVRNALLKLFTTSFGQAKEPESPVIRLTLGTALAGSVLAAPDRPEALHDAQRAVDMAGPAFKSLSLAALGAAQLDSETGVFAKRRT